MDTTVISNGPRKSTVSRPPLPTEEELGKNKRDFILEKQILRKVLFFRKVPQCPLFLTWNSNN